MAAERRKTYRGRGFRLLSATICSVVVAVIAICTAISLSVISSSTQQTNEALETAINAYDCYLRSLGGESSRVQDLEQALDDDGLLDSLAQERDLSDEGLIAADGLVSRISSYETDMRGYDSQARLYLYFPKAGRMVGSEGNGVDPRDSSHTASFDPRLAQVDESLLAADAEDAGFIAQLNGTSWHVEIGSVVPGVRYVMFLLMPELPSAEILTPISDLCELYFADRYGHKYSYSENPRFADVFEFSDLTGQGSSGFVALERDGIKYRCYYEDNSPGYNKFVLVTYDVVAAAQREFMGVILVAGILLVLGGCLVGFLLTRRVYEPLQHIVDRLSPQGRRVNDEFALIGRTLEGMESSLAEQRETIADFGLMRLLRDPSEDALVRAAQTDATARDGMPFYLHKDASCALVVVRVDRAWGPVPAAGETPDASEARSNTSETSPMRPLAAVDMEQARSAIGEFLDARAIGHAACIEGRLAFVVIDAQDLGESRDVPALANGLLECLADAGMLATVFTSAVYSGPAMLNASYREVMRAMDYASPHGVRGTVVAPGSILSGASGDERVRPTLGTSGLFEDMCAYIKGNFRDSGLSSGQLAQRFGMSQASVTRLFKQRTNGSFLDYVHTLRIQEAESLLVSTNLSVAEVADRVGYGDTSTMTRAFKRYRGKTPGECRADGRSGRD